ncbi:hypothetical protein JTY60_00615 [symbiont of Argiope bruennichi]|uniref:NusA N-terminal domain-containing protein n=1 Tax=symbiont of Argiope bruennichi TaxID=2810479 RepID=UPI003DA4AB91
MKNESKKMLGSKSNKKIFLIINSLLKERSIPLNTISEFLEISIQKAYKKMENIEPIIKANINQEKKEVGFFRVFNIKENIEDDTTEIQEKDCDPKYIDKENNLYLQPIDLTLFSISAVQIFKQVFLKKITDFQNNKIIKYFKNLSNKIIFGEVFAISEKVHEIYYMNCKCILPNNQLIPNEELKVHHFYYFYILDIKEVNSDFVVYLSRKHINLLTSLLKKEIPEIQNDQVEIKAGWRVPGQISKIIVNSNVSNIDPLGACLGIQNERINSIQKLINNEKIYFIRYLENKIDMISECFPRVDIKLIIKGQEEDRIVNYIVVDDDKLFLAIGKKFININLLNSLYPEDNYKIITLSELDKVKEIPEEIKVDTTDQIVKTMEFSLDENEKIDDIKNDFDEDILDDLSSKKDQIIIDEPQKKEKIITDTKITLDLQDVKLDFDDLMKTKEKQIVKKTKKSKEKSFEKLIDENSLVVDEDKLKEIDKLLDDENLIDDEKYDDFENL